MNRFLGGFSDFSPSRCRLVLHSYTGQILRDLSSFDQNFGQAALIYSLGVTIFIVSALKQCNDRNAPHVDKGAVYTEFFVMDGYRAAQGACKRNAA